MSVGGIECSEAVYAPLQICVHNNLFRISILKHRLIHVPGKKPLFATVFKPV